MARAHRRSGTGGFSLTVAAVGRGRGEPAQALYEDYAGRLPWPVRLVEVREARDLPPPARIAAEGEKLQAALPSGARVAALDAGGDAMTSEAFAALIGRWRDDGAGDVGFLIGGADGLEPGLVQAADRVLSLGPMIWPHMLVRAMLAEQLWRAASILSGHPYHRG